MLSTASSLFVRFYSLKPDHTGQDDDAVNMRNMNYWLLVWYFHQLQLCMLLLSCQLESFRKSSTFSCHNWTSVHNWEKKNNIRLACHINSRHFVASALVSTEYYQKNKTICFICVRCVFENIVFQFQNKFCRIYYKNEHLLKMWIMSHI